MIDLSNLINMLPSFFKEKDTYKDKEGKGILERFLNICGNYFKNDISDQIDNILDIMDLDFDSSNIPADDPRKKYEHLFLNSIWEFLGEIPYGYSALYDSNKNGENPWITNSNGIPRAECRRLLKYAISLYKIRGTLDFYNILLRFYGLSCKVLDPSGIPGSPNGFYGRVYRDKVNVVLRGNNDEYLGIKEKGEYEEIVPYVTYDSDLVYDLDDSTYDSALDCLGCSTVYLSIGTSKYGDLNSLQKEKVLLLLNKFRPVNIVPFSLENTNFINYL